MPVTGFAIVNASNGPFLPVNLCKPPSEGPRVCNVKMTFTGQGTTNLVSLNQGQLGGAAMSQLASLCIDNTRCNQILTTRMPDSGQIIQTPGYSRQWVNLLTSGLTFTCDMATDVFDAVVEVQCCNFSCVESIQTIVFDDQLLETFVFQDPVISLWVPGTQFTILGAADNGAFIHLTDISINRANFQTASTLGLEEQAELWYIQDDSNPTVILATVVLPVNVAGTAVSDFNVCQPLAPGTGHPLGTTFGETGFSKKGLNYITAKPNGNIVLANAGESKYTTAGGGALLINCRYGYYTFPSYT